MLNGIPAIDPKARTIVGYLSEQHKIPPHISGLKYLRRSAAGAGITGSAAARKIDRVLTVCDMRNDAEKLSEVEKICQTAAIMDNGRIIVQGTINRIVQNDETLEDVFLRHVGVERGQNL